MKPITPDERLLIGALSILCLEWQLSAERETLLGLVRTALPKTRRELGFVALTDAADWLLRARPGTTDWIGALHATSRALATVLRSDLVQAIRQSGRAA